MTPIRPCYFCAFRPATVVTTSGDACASCVREHGILPTTIEDEPEEVTPTIPPTKTWTTVPDPRLSVNEAWFFQREMETLFGAQDDDEWHDEYMTGILAVPQ